MLKFTVVSLTSLFLLAGCNTAPPAPATPAVDIAAEQGKIRDLEAAWSKDAGAKDLEKSVANYADDAILMTPGMPAAKGKDAIRAAWKDMLADPKGKLAFATERVDHESGLRIGLQLPRDILQHCLACVVHSSTVILEARARGQLTEVRPLGWRRTLNRSGCGTARRAVAYGRGRNNTNLDRRAFHNSGRIEPGAGAATRDRPR